ncbi:MAG: hypothetical protein VYC39_09085 [Myxococcota bacterium]|nr:hypothetical protein [Myxococcota bacterium]
MPSNHNRDAAKAWLKQRLSNERFASEWKSLLHASIESFVDLPVSELISKDDLQRIVSESLTRDVMNAIQQELASPLFHYLIERLKIENTTFADWTTPAAVQDLVDVVESPGIIQQEWIEEFFRQDAVSEVLVDSIYSALREFSTIIPRLVLRSLPSGRFKALGLAGNLTEKIAGQLEKIIEPEIRAFLSTRSQSLIARACEFTTGQLDSPTSRNMRANLFRYGIEQKLSFHTAGVDKARLEVLEDAIKHHFEGLPQNTNLSQAMEQEILHFFENYGKRPLKELAPELTVQLLGRTETIAATTLPLIFRSIEVPQVSDWLDSLVEELIDVYEK